MIKEALIQHFKHFIKENALNYYFIDSKIRTNPSIENSNFDNYIIIDFNDMTYFYDMFWSSKSKIDLDDPNIIKFLENVLLNWTPGKHYFRWSL